MPEPTDPRDTAEYLAPICEALQEVIAIFGPLDTEQRIRTLAALCTVMQIDTADLNKRVIS